MQRRVPINALRSIRNSFNREMPQSLDQSDFCVVLVRPKVSGNIGATARCMFNMGFRDLRLVDPQANHLNKESLDRAVDAQKIVTESKIFLETTDATKDCHHVIGTTRKKRDFPLPTHKSNELGPVIFKNEKRKYALLFGPEDTGLINDDLIHCESVISIPTDDIFPSLNLSHAVMIVLYELFLELKSTDKSIYTQMQAQEVTAEKKEEFFVHLKESLLSINYLDKNNPDRMMKELRNIFVRARLDERELSLLRGICRQILNRCS